MRKSALSLTFALFSLEHIRLFGVESVDRPFPFRYIVLFFLILNHCFRFLPFPLWINHPPYMESHIHLFKYRKIEKYNLRNTAHSFFPYLSLDGLDLVCKRWRWKASQTCTHLFFGFSLLLSRLYLRITVNSNCCFAVTHFTFCLCPLVGFSVLARE